MNRARRKEIERIVALLNDISLEEIIDAIDDVRADEQDAFDNMPESLQASESGERAEQAASSLEEAHSHLEQILSTIGEVICILEEAAE
jgi:DNA-binding transcriptional MerR regulator